MNRIAEWVLIISILLSFLSPFMKEEEKKKNIEREYSPAILCVPREDETGKPGVQAFNALPPIDKRGCMSAKIRRLNPNTLAVEFNSRWEPRSPIIHSYLKGVITLTLTEGRQGNTTRFQRYVGTWLVRQSGGKSWQGAIPWLKCKGDLVQGLTCFGVVQAAKRNGGGLGESFGRMYIEPLL